MEYIFKLIFLFTGLCSFIFFSSFMIVYITNKLFFVKKLNISKDDVLVIYIKNAKEQKKFENLFPKKLKSRIVYVRDDLKIVKVNTIYKSIYFHYF